MTALSIEVDGLRKVYLVREPGTWARTRLVAVDDVSFSLPVGGALGIVGESGSGKTTIARIIAGLERPGDGRIVVNGRERLNSRVGLAERRRRAREVQIVFQDPYSSLDPRQRIADALAEVLRRHFPQSKGERESRVEQLLEQVGLDARQGRAYPRALSGGQRQRVAIARALAAEPDILVLDEPTSALDVSIQAQVINVLADIRRQAGIGYLFVSHDLAVVRQLTDEAMVMQNGRIVERGRTDEILDAPQHPYTKQLLNSVPTRGWKPQRRSIASL
jgi:oligopeptide transport system ATP-binding protein